MAYIYVVCYMRIVYMISAVHVYNCECRINHVCCFM